MNKLWAFGDSFTWGTGINPADENAPYGPDAKWYPHILKEKLGCRSIQIVAAPGQSFEHIMYSIIMHMHAFSHKDFVVFSSTTGERLSVPIMEKWPELFKDPTNQDLKLDPISDWKGIGSAASAYILEGVYQGVVAPQVPGEAFVDYMHDVTTPLLHQFDCRNLAIAKALAKFINTRLCRCVGWSHDLFFNTFESVTDDPDNDTVDGHWSLRGTDEFVKYFMMAFKDKKYWFDKEYYHKKVG